MDINRLSLWVVTFAYPFVSMAFLVLSVALFARYYFIKRREWIMACSFVCLLFAIGMGLSSLAISALPRYPREVVIPWSRLVLSSSAIPLSYAAYSVTREVLEYLLQRSGGIHGLFSARFLFRWLSRHSR